MDPEKNKEKTDIPWVLTLILIVVSLMLFYIFWSYATRDPIQDIESFVCSNLEKEEGEHVLIYYSIIRTKTIIQNELKYSIEYINGEESEPLQFDKGGVICSMPAKMCDYLYCVNIDMLVPVNYTEWNAWYYE